MIYINKRTEPRTLTWYRSQKNASFDDMDLRVKEELRKSLLAEQGYICAYCMSRIKSQQDTKIEHFEKRNSENELVYSNLLAVCRGGEGKPRKEQTCDTFKQDRELQITPLNRDHMKTICYSNSGEIISSNSRFNSEINEILNLNCKFGYLIENRKGALNTIKKQISKHVKEGQAIEAYFQKLHKIYFDDTFADELHTYVGIIRWYIEKKLKRQ